MHKTSFSWDSYFLGMAQYVSTKSKDPSTKCGAVIVRPNLTSASTGYNGLPQNMPDKLSYYENRAEKYSRIIHAEMNALMFAHEDKTGYTLYTTGMCCDRCAVHMLQAGISRFVYVRDSEDMLSRWKEQFERTMSYFKEAGVEVCEFLPEDVHHKYKTAGM